MKLQIDIANQKLEGIRGTTVKILELEKLIMEQLWTMHDENMCATHELIQEKA